MITKNVDKIVENKIKKEVDKDLDKVSSPGFDARLGTANLLAKLVGEATMCQQNNDLEGWFKCLRQIFSIIRIYISKEHREVLKNNFDKADLLFKSIYNRRLDHKIVDLYRPKLINLLWDTNDNLLFYGAPLFMPSSDKNEDNFDIEEFMKGAKER